MAPSVAQAKKKPKALLIVAVIAVVAVLLVAAIALAGGGNTKATHNNGNTGNNDSTDNTDNNGGSSNTNTATNSQITMTVSDVQGRHSTSQYEQPSDGNIVVMVYANITNNGALSLFVAPLDFFLICSDGNSYDASYYLGSFSSTNLAHGNTMAVYCAFEIPQGVTPKSLKYDDDIDSISVSIASSIIDLTYPQYVSITGASYAVVSSDSSYLTPAAGNEFVQVTMMLKNLMPTSITMSTYDFTLETSDGQTHHVTYYVDPVMPDGLLSGASATVKVTFEISQSSTPTKLIYDDYVNHVTVDL